MDSQLEGLPAIPASSWVSRLTSHHIMLNHLALPADTNDRIATVYSSLAIVHVVHVRVQSLIAFSCSKLVAKAIFSDKF